MGQSASQVASDAPTAPVAAAPANGPDPARGDRLAVSYARCRRLAASHYENFTVLSRLLLPPDRRDDFAAIYAFCRTADDAADEIADRDESLRRLAALHRLIDDLAAGRPVASESFDFAPALADVFARHRLPSRPFHNLIDAFEQDRRVDRYETWDRLIDYCTRSANPVGRLVLLVTGHADRADLDRLFDLSDSICTGLQLANHWQDVARDLLERDRIYLPREAMEARGLDDAQLREMVHQRRADRRFRDVLADLVGRTWPMFRRGRELWPLVESAARPSVELFTLGGEAVLAAIERQGFDVLVHRPRISRSTKLRLLAGAWWRARRRGHAEAAA